MFTKLIAAIIATMLTMLVLTYLIAPFVNVKGTLGAELISVVVGRPIFVVILLLSEIVITRRKQ